ncbi:MAG: hypothetical protein AAF492_17445, partial [Verrucomicrobiota bacterium]
MNKISLLPIQVFILMKTLIIADEDSFRWSGPADAVDLVISCGDTADQFILDAAEAHQCSEVFAVKGNHDGSGKFPAPITDLHLST